MKKQNIIIIGLIAVILTMAVGYALFSETININGTATADGTFDVEFTSVGTPTCIGFTGTCDAATLTSISTDKNTLNITVNKLEFPGAYVEIPVTITNKGSVSAKLKNINETGLTADSRAIKVTYTGVAASDTPIDTNGTQEMNIKVEWDKTVNTGSSDVTFQIQLEYEQAQ